MGVLLTTAARNAACDAIVTLLNADGAGSITIYDDSSPEVALAVLTFSATAFGAAVTGVATANTITEEDSALDTGTPDSAVFATGASPPVTIFSCDCGVGSGSINFPSTITTGVEVQITSLTFAVPPGSL